MSPRTRVLVICSKAECTNHSWEVLSGPLDLLPFLKTVEKGATTLVLFAYAMYAMLYLLLPSGALLTVAFGCFTSCCLRVLILYTVPCGTFSEAGGLPSQAVNANPKSVSEDGLRHG